MQLAPTWHCVVPAIPVPLGASSRSRTLLQFGGRTQICCELQISAPAQHLPLQVTRGLGQVHCPLLHVPLVPLFVPNGQIVPFGSLVTPQVPLALHTGSWQTGAAGH